MVLYRITLTPLAEELILEDSGFISLLYAYDAVFDNLEQRSAQLLKMLIDRGPDRGISLKELRPSSPRMHQGRRRRQKKYLQQRGYY